MKWSRVGAAQTAARGGAFLYAAVLATVTFQAHAQTDPAGAPVPPGEQPGSTPAESAPAPAGESPPLEPSPLVQGESDAPPPVYPEAPPPPPPEPPPPEPEEPSRSDAGPFSQGSIRLSLLAGTGSVGNDTYLILGAGVGYYLLDGFEVGLDYEAWILEDPVLHRLSPETRYVLHFVPTLKPYVGVFYRHTFVGDGFDDLDHVGARLGAYIMPSPSRMYIGVGAVYEHLLGCDNSDWYDCDAVYPELSIGIAF